jgi:hypothetical protein
MVKSEDGKYTFTPTLPNKYRFRAKLEKLQKTKPDAVLGDVIEPKNIIFRITSPDSEDYNLSMRFDEIEKVIAKKLRSFVVTDKIYEEFKTKEIQKSKIKDSELVRERS